LNFRKPAKLREFYKLSGDDVACLVFIKELDG
jgi:hypothetical protein